MSEPARKAFYTDLQASLADTRAQGLFKPERVITWDHAKLGGAY